MNALFATASDGNELSLRAMRHFRDSGVDVLAMQYGGNPIRERGVRVFDDCGGKWQLARRHLCPRMVEDYDFIFLWDDDIDVNGFDVRGYLQIMIEQNLAMAQPALKDGSYVSHVITRQREGIGRITNFVEIMVPVFTREAWLRCHSELTADNFSGWGYDFMPDEGRKGIIDRHAVVHTRPVRSRRSRSLREMRKTLEKKGWQYFRPAVFAAMQGASHPACRDSAG